MFVFLSIFDAQVECATSAARASELRIPTAGTCWQHSCCGCLVRWLQIPNLWYFPYCRCIQLSIFMRYKAPTWFSTPNLWKRLALGRQLGYNSNLAAVPRDVRAICPSECQGLHHNRTWLAAAVSCSKQFGKHKRRWFPLMDCLCFAKKIESKEIFMVMFRKRGCNFRRATV